MRLRFIGNVNMNAIHVFNAIHNGQHNTQTHIHTHTFANMDLYAAIQCNRHSKSHSQQKQKNKKSEAGYCN